MMHVRWGGKVYLRLNRQRGLLAEAVRGGRLFMLFSSLARSEPLRSDQEFKAGLRRPFISATSVLILAAAIEDSVLLLGFCNYDYRSIWFVSVNRFFVNHFLTL